MGATNSNYPYLREVDSYFAPYLNLTAVKMANSMIHKQLLAYDAIPEFALHLDPENFSKIMNWSDMREIRPWLNPEKLNEFASAVAEFANETDFWGFYNSHREFYRKTLETFVKENGYISNLVKIEEEFFGENASAWYIEPQLVFCCHGFGYHMNTTNGMAVYAFLGLSYVSGGIPHVQATASSSSFLAHEFAHSFVNPAVDRHYDLFRPYESLFDPVSQELRKMAYTNFRIMLYETLVRAFEAYYLNVTVGPSAAEEKLRQNERVFYFIRDVYIFLLKASPFRAGMQ
ncbi:DUF4932 domain-containing protein [Thermococcus stetteri]|uniref:DUF4932 domain-containing protein n=1 Tax=Thermococcus stetteri TaxID=49900 RepID=UPI003158437C